MEWVRRHEHQAVAGQVDLLERRQVVEDVARQVFDVVAGEVQGRQAGQSLEVGGRQCGEAVVREVEGAGDGGEVGVRHVGALGDVRYGFDDGGLDRCVASADPAGGLGLCAVPWVDDEHRCDELAGSVILRRGRRCPTRSDQRRGRSYAGCGFQIPHAVAGSLGI